MSSQQGYDGAARDEDILADQTSDDTDRGWGERTEDDDENEDDERLILDKPPHW